MSFTKRAPQHMLATRMVAYSTYASYQERTRAWCMTSDLWPRQACWACPGNKWDVVHIVARRISNFSSLVVPSRTLLLIHQRSIHITVSGEGYTTNQHHRDLRERTVAPRAIQNQPNGFTSVTLLQHLGLSSPWTSSHNSTKHSNHGHRNTIEPIPSGADNAILQPL